MELALECLVKNYYEEAGERHHQKIIVDMTEDSANCEICKMVKSKIDSEEWQNKMANVAKTNSNWKYRKKAVKYLGDQKLLADISSNDKHYHVREAAVNAIMDQKILLDIAKNSGYQHLQICAVNQIKNQDILAEIAHDVFINEAVCIEAVNKITDQTLLTNIASRRGGRPGYKAIERLWDKEVLNALSKRTGDAVYARDRLKFIELMESGQKYEEILNNSKLSGSVCAMAIEKINDQKVLADIFFKADSILNTLSVNTYNQTDRNTHGTMMNAALKNITDQDLLADIYKKSGYCRKELLEKLDPDKWQSIFIDVIHSDSYYREIAVRKLNAAEYQDLFYSLAKNDQSESVRAAAVEKILNQEFLNDLTRNADDFWVREAAKTGQPYKTMTIIGTLNGFPIMAPVELDIEGPLLGGIRFTGFEKPKAVDNTEELQNELDLKVGATAFDQYGNKIGVIKFHRYMDTALLLIVNKSDMYILNNEFGITQGTFLNSYLKNRLKVN